MSSWKEAGSEGAGLPHIAWIGRYEGVENLLTDLAGKGYLVTYIPHVFDSPSALTKLDPDFAVLVADDQYDIDLLRELITRIHTVVITRQASDGLRNKALSAGCGNFFSSASADQLCRVFANGCTRITPAKIPTPLSKEEEDHRLIKNLLLGDSALIHKISLQIRKVAPTTASVLIEGESGTGKEMAAQAIHRLSHRREQKFVAVNCGAIHPQLIESEFFGHTKGSFTGAVKDHIGYFERAHKGTLFLDEITEMPIELQVKLLRVLETHRFCQVGSVQEREVDIRVIAATNRDPQAAVEEGLLRRDLLYRIRVFPLRLPPLRERKDDLKLIVRHFLNEYNARENTTKRFSAKALEMMLTYPWPGNLRELKNAVHSAFIMSNEVIETADLSLDITQTPPKAMGPVLRINVGSSLSDTERDLILATLEYCDGKRSRAARMLGVSVKTLYNRLREYRDFSEKEFSYRDCS